MALISVICIDCDSDFIDEQLVVQGMPDLEVVEIETGKDFFDDINHYLTTTDSEYVFFLENTTIFDKYHMVTVVNLIIKFPSADFIFSPQKYIDEEGIIAHIDGVLQELNEGELYNMELLLKYVCSSRVNIIGGLSSIVGKKSAFLKNIALNSLYYTYEKSLQKSIFMYNAILNSSFVINKQETVACNITRLSNDEIYAGNPYKKHFLQQYIIERGWEVIHSKHNVYSNIKKEITFFYTDQGEYFNVQPIAVEAQKRGYQIKYTKDLDEKAEIGVYCQHVCRPENAKFSIILLHDMLQGHNRWPDIWNLERWDKFDIGILPGEDWKYRFCRCAARHYLHPKYGVYAMGYPKSDLIMEDSIINKASELRKALGLKDRLTVLYAPSWENDDKEDDFVRALQSLNINLLVKQANWPSDYSHIIHNIDTMRKLHEGEYENLYYVETDESIMVALSMCDIVVSDESSVMVEALMYGKPSIAVLDWLIPDEMPARCACVPIDYVYKCKKVELRETIQKFMDGKLDTPFDKDNPFFNNIGNVCRNIVDAIEYYLYDGKETDFLRWKIECKYPILDAF